MRVNGELVIFGSIELNECTAGSGGGLTSGGVTSAGQLLLQNCLATSDSVNSAHLRKLFDVHIQ